MVIRKDILAKQLFYLSNNKSDKRCDYLWSRSVLLQSWRYDNTFSNNCNLISLFLNVVLGIPNISAILT